MRQQFPLIHDFCRLYWNQTGPEVYGTLDGALRQMLADAAKLPDNGQVFKRSLAEEFMQLDARFEQLATDGPQGRCLNVQSAYFFREHVVLLKALALAEVAGRDS